MHARCRSRSLLAPLISDTCADPPNPDPSPQGGGEDQQGRRHAASVFFSRTATHAPPPMFHVKPQIPVNYGPSLDPRVPKSPRAGPVFLNPNDVKDLAAPEPPGSEPTPVIRRQARLERLVEGASLCRARSAAAISAACPPGCSGARSAPSRRPGRGCRKNRRGAWSTG